MDALNLVDWREPAKRRKVPQEIAYHIRKQILSGSLPHGSKLPSEQSLTSTLCVSRQTLREGLRILEAQGLLRIKSGQNGGAFVSEAQEEAACAGLVNFLHNKQLTVAHLTEVRKVVEPYLVRQAARKISDADIAALEELQEKALEEIRENEFNRVRAIEISFHGQIAAIAGNPLLSFINAFISHLLVGMKQRLKPSEAFSLSVARAHDNILAALKRRDEDAAAEAIVQDIEMVMGTLTALAEDQGLLNWKLIAG